jgi:tetratricopeptide (TPR) repeat protein
MNMYKQFFFLLIFIGVSQLAISQKKVWVKFGDQSMAVHDAYSAAKFYSKAVAEDSADLGVEYKLAKAFMGYQNYEKALPIFLVVLKNKQEEEFGLIHHDLGKVYKHLGDFENSIKHYEVFIKRGDKSSFEYLAANNEVANFEKVKLLIQDTLKVKVNNLPGTVNTGASEFSPVLLNDTVLMFSSLRAMSVLEDGTVQDLDYSAGIYKAHKKDTAWHTGAQFEVKGLDALSFANGSFNDDKTEFYFSVCKEFGSCNIYQGKLNRDSIVEYVVLPAPINLIDVSSTHPFITEIKGKKTLLFSSNRTGGKGGMDLWVSTYKGKWTVPKNLGKNINTLGNELTPFFDADSNELYFSSDWHYNIGGLDIFSAQGDFPSSWDTVVNIGIPYNSPVNDLYYIQNGELEGFLTSSREGSKTEKDAPCCNDIYDFKREKEIIESLEEEQLFSSLYQHNVKVYFHNDRPNVDSWDTLTTLNYDTAYYRYTPRFKEYRKEFSAQFKGERSESARLAIDTFFNNSLYKGHDDLISFTEKLIEELDSGRSVEVQIKGFASPLTKSDYNVNLSRRRISSVMNFLFEYKDSVLGKYMIETDSSAAMLIFLKNPNGEYKSQKGVSDDYYDVRNSIFNPSAALERKVELYANLIYQEHTPVLSLFSNQDTLIVNGKKAYLNSFELAVHYNGDGGADEVVVMVDEKMVLESPVTFDPGQLRRLTIPLNNHPAKECKLIFKGKAVQKELLIIFE